MWPSGTIALLLLLWSDVVVVVWSFHCGRGLSQASRVSADAGKTPRVREGVVAVPPKVGARVDVKTPIVGVRGRRNMTDA